MPELSDDTLLDDVLLTSRCRNILRWPEPAIRTVGELRQMSDADLMSRPNCGKMAMLEFRLLTGQRKPGKNYNNPSDQALKQRWVREVYFGTCDCSFEQWKQERHNAAGQ